MGFVTNVLQRDLIYYEIVWSDGELKDVHVSWKKSCEVVEDVEMDISMFFFSYGFIVII